MSKKTRLFYFVLYVLVMVFTDESSYSVPPPRNLGRTWYLYNKMELNLKKNGSFIYSLPVSFGNYELWKSPWNRIDFKEFKNIHNWKIKIWIFMIDHPETYKTPKRQWTNADEYSILLSDIMQNMQICVWEWYHWPCSDFN